MVCIGIALSIIQLFVGINVIFYYSSTLWQAVGFTEADALTQTVITSVTNIVVTLIAIALIDKIGRKLLLTKIGRASCRERGKISEVDVRVKDKDKRTV